MRWPGTFGESGHRPGSYGHGRPSPPPTPDEIAAAVREERHRLGDWLATLTDQQWRTQSCTAWTVRDVLAHLTSTTRQTVPAVVREAGSPRRVKGLRLVVTDSSWVHGSGDQVQGCELDLLLTASGRSDGLPGLAGPGLEGLHERLEGA